MLLKGACRLHKQGTVCVSCYVLMLYAQWCAAWT